MQRRLTQTSFLLIAAPVMAACSYFGSDAPAKPEPPSVAPVGQLTSECARLQPLFVANEQKLSREQMDAGLKTEFAKWDKDKNGDLSNSEVGPLNDSLRAENVGASPVTDWNGDGHVDFQEFASGWRTMFDLCDGNRDKMVSYRELGRSPNVTPPAVVAAPAKPPEGASKTPDRGGAY
jgi:hypothetical protein